MRSQGDWMLKRKCTAATSIVVLIISCIGASFGAAIPCGPKAKTQADLDEALRAFNHRTIVDAYKKYGIRNPAWDNSALYFLEEYAASIVPKGGSADMKKILSDGEALIFKGCNDPMVESCCGIDSLIVGDANADLARKSIDDFNKSRYPKWRAGITSVCILEMGEINKDSDRKKLQDTMIDLISAAFADGSFDAGDDGVVSEEYIKQDDFKWILHGRWMDLYNAIQKKATVCPYAVKTIGGMCHIWAAWDARGEGWASSVTEEGRKTFKSNLDEAKELLTAAWKMNPEYPQAPADMITVTMGDDAGNLAELRTWFDRAAAAQMDYPLAYTHLLWGMMPRWGGSLDALYDFGVECLKTRRFDTGVPWQFYNALHNISMDSEQHPKDYWKRPDTGKRLDIMFDGYIANAPAQTDWYESEKAAAACYCERYSVARKIMEHLGTRVQPAAFAVFNLSYDKSLGEILTHDGKLGAEIEKADALSDAGEYDRALAAYKNLPQNIREAKLTAPYLNRRMEILRLHAGMQSGKWISLTPPADFSGWKTPEGHWKVSTDGSVQGSSETGGLILQPEINVGTRWEISGDVEYISGVYGQHPNAGVIWNWPNESFFSALVFKDLGRASVREQFDTELDATPNIPLNRVTHLQVQMWENNVRLYVNGNAVADTDKLSVSESKTESPVAIGGYYWYAGGVVKFSNLRIRRLVDNPFK
jgi:tetratricopeptide (TPR) repeat protein